MKSAPVRHVVGVSRPRRRHSHRALRMLITAPGHEGAIQSIFAVGLGLRRCRQLLPRQPAQAGERLGDCLHGLGQVIGELRAHILHLSQDAETPVALEDALTAVAERMSRLGAVHVTLDIEPALAERLAPRESLHLVNIAREALSNSVRHGESTQPRIELRSSGHEVEFTATDNGSGLAERLPAEGQGIKNIRERARALGGAVMASEAARVVVDRAGGGTSARGPFERLTGQERRVCELVGLGRTNRETAEALGLTEKTVRNYLSRAFEKLGLQRRSQMAALFAQRSSSA